MKLFDYGGYYCCVGGGVDCGGCGSFWGQYLILFVD